MFQLTKEEVENLIFQNGISKENSNGKEVVPNWHLKFETRWETIQSLCFYRPWCFDEC